MKKTFLLTGLLIAISNSLFAQITTRVVKDGLFIPWELVYGPDDHIWFTQKNGYICRTDPATSKTDTLYYESNTYVQSESGMLGMALDPGFPAQPYVYVAYNYSQGGIKVRIVRYTYAGGVLQSPLTLLENIAGSGIHNGCRLLFVDGKLYITTGDAANQALPQNLGSVNGKVLRINPDGTIPSDNPIPGSPVWSWGHRNAQGLVYANGKLFSSEHGDVVDDEINIIHKGRNYGWPNVKGFCDGSELAFCNDSNVVEPVIAWTPTLAVCGLDYYNQPMFPAFQNSLLMTTLKDQKLRQLKLNATQDSVISSTVIVDSFGRLRDLCISPGGRIYISTSNSQASGGGSKIDKIIEIYDPSFIPVSVGRGEDKAVLVYPNPADDKLYIEITDSSVFKNAYLYKITDAAGKTVMGDEITGNTTLVNIKSLPPALYQMQIIRNNQIVGIEKIIKR